jgi:hypothetical protein
MHTESGIRIRHAGQNGRAMAASIAERFRTSRHGEIQLPDSVELPAAELGVAEVVIMLVLARLGIPIASAVINELEELALTCHPGEDEVTCRIIIQDTDESDTRRRSYAFTFTRSGAGTVFAAIRGTFPR